MNIKTIIFIMTVFLTGCDNHDVNNATTEIARFHSMYNTKEFNEIYDSMLTNEFRNSTSKNNYISFMNQTYNILGVYRNSTLKKSNQIKSLIGNEKIELTYNTTYERYNLDEFFLLEKEDGCYKIKKIVYDDINAIKRENN